MASYPLIDPEEFFGVLASDGKIRGATGAKLDEFGYGQFRNGVKHTIAIWAPKAPPEALKLGEVQPETVIHVRIIPEGQQRDAYFMARVGNEKALHLECTPLDSIHGLKADNYFAYYSPRFNQYGFVARYENYVFLYYISVRLESEENADRSALERIREFDNHVHSVLRNAL